MELRLARRGRNAGGHFWGCTGYRLKGPDHCEGTLDALPDEVPTVGSATPSETAATIREPRLVVAAPLHEGLDTTYFEYLTVPSSELEGGIDAHDSGSPVIGAHWRISYRREPQQELREDMVRALSVADKLVCKGHVTLLPPWLEGRLGNVARVGSHKSELSVAGPRLDSEEERLFWEGPLREMLGRGRDVWVVPQVEVATLTGSADFGGTEQRVDFLVAHPNLASPLVIEIDGAQHTSAGAADSVRDSHLTASGYEVLRIPVGEIRAQVGPSLQVLRQRLSQLSPYEEYESSFRNPFRRAGQVQLCLLAALHLGIASPAQQLRVSTDLVRSGELTGDEFGLILRDFSSLMAALGTLYDVELLPGGVVPCDDPQESDVHLGFHEYVPGRGSIIIEDSYLPLPVKWAARPVTPGLPASFDRELLTYFLQRTFWKREFRDGQYDIISRALQGQDTVALLPTGAGKSIAFQLAGMLIAGRTIVVAPTVALIRDQVENLRYSGIDRALGITGELSGRTERDAAYNLLRLGEAFFYYVAPERFQMAEFREKLRGMTAAFPVSLIVVDEAHCVSEWGHDFRTSYLRIGETSRACSTADGWTPPLIATTGTASRAVLRDLQRELQITAFDAIVTPSSFDREELHYVIKHERSDHKAHVLPVYLANSLPAAFGVSGESFFRSDGHDTYCGLVFCPNVNGSFGVVEVAGLLSGQGIRAKYYSGSRPKNFPGNDTAWNAYKRATEREFKRNDLPVLVATKAFGMGVDKANIRFTVHYGIPASIEAFYQEAGRAGRDGHKAICAAIVSDDHAAANQQMLAPATAIEDVAAFVKSLKYEENDDVARALFFHVQSFKGIDTEVSAVRAVLGQLSPTGSYAVRSLPFGDDGKLTEKALHRLVVIGVVADYTVDYSSRAFGVTLADASRRSVIDKYVSYVAGYQKGRSTQERRKADQLPEAWDDFVVGVARLYVQFVYDVIERGQRRAIAEMLAACRSGSGEDLRSRILDYLRTDRSDAVEAILNDPDSGLGCIAEIVADIVSPNDAGVLRGPVARSLETYPDHPGLLLLRALTEGLARDCNEQTVLENFHGFLLNASETYGVRPESITRAVALALRTLAGKNAPLALNLERAFIDRGPDRVELRLLVSESGLDAAQVVPWLLLEDVADEANRYIGSERLK